MHNAGWVRIGAVCLFVYVGAVGCGSDQEPSHAGKPGVELLPAGWNKIEPGGRTMCARGTPWEFYVRLGKVNKVVVEFEGGGACWDSLSCLPGAHIFYDSLHIPPEMAGESVATGILDHADARCWSKLRGMSCAKMIMTIRCGVGPTRSSSGAGSASP